MRFGTCQNYFFRVVDNILRTGRYFFRFNLTLKLKKLAIINIINIINLAKGIIYVMIKDIAMHYIY